MPLSPGDKLGPYEILVPIPVWLKGMTGARLGFSAVRKRGSLSKKPGSNGTTISGSST